MPHVCPWWYAYAFDNVLRRILHPPEKILGEYVKPGMTVLDVGCGMGHFSIGMARMVGDQGRVIAVDLQQKMLDVMMRRARRHGVAQQITPHFATETSFDLAEPVDFALAFWMVHETPDVLDTFRQFAAVVKPGGYVYVAEPPGHITDEALRETVSSAVKAGLMLIEGPTRKIRYSHVMIFQMPEPDGQ
jgi:ubiquinone/menaquinone biosynthesis C-methylase UbiE